MHARIWVIDDDETAREYLTVLLQDSGHTVTTYSDAREALARYRRGDADLVVTDVRMPGLDGLEFTRSLLARDPGAVIVVVTAYPSIPDAVEAIKAGATDYICKPFRADELRTRIERAIRSSDLMSRLRRSRALTWLLIGSMPLWFLLGFVFAQLCRP
jgi:two-component system, NtrC family, response regulator HydG